jgi:3-phosphoshikimate 1-carboxyvinyltransferase
MGSLAQGETFAYGLRLLSGKQSSNIRAIEAFGAKVTKISEGLKIVGGKYKAPDDVIDVGNSGTTMAFLLGASGTCPGTSVLTGDESIRRRPLQPLLNALNQIGVECWSTRGNGLPPIVVKGGEIKGGESRVSGALSQWLSGLLIATPLAGSDTFIHVEGELRERPYIAMTLSMLKEFGIQVSISNNMHEYHVPSSQAYRPCMIQIPGDLGLAAFALGAAALCDSSDVTYQNIDLGVAHAENRILDLIKEMGADVRADRETKSVRVVGGRRLEGIDIDIADSPDIFPILCVLASLAKGKTNLYHAEQVRHKECDRIRAMLELKRMGANVQERQDGLEIEGVKELHGASVDSFNDHRVLMALVVAGSFAEGKTIISNPDCYKVSYPFFLKDMKKLGMKLAIS